MQCAIRVMINAPCRTFVEHFFRKRAGNEGENLNRSAWIEENVTIRRDAKESKFVEHLYDKCLQVALYQRITRRKSITEIVEIRA